MNVKENSVLNVFLESYRDAEPRLICDCSQCGGTYSHKKYSQDANGNHILSSDLMNMLVNEIQMGLFDQWCGNYYMLKHFNNEYGPLTYKISINITSRKLDRKADVSDYAVKDIPEVADEIDRVRKHVAANYGCEPSNVMTHCMMNFDMNMIDIYAWNLLKSPR